MHSESTWGVSFRKISPPGGRGVLVPATPSIPPARSAIDTYILRDRVPPHSKMADKVSKQSHVAPLIKSKQWRKREKDGK